MQPNELTLEAQMFDAKINSMDKTCLLAPLSFFDACNVSTDEERLRRMMLLRTRALQLGISEQEYADRRDNYTSQFDADPSYCLKIARMALRRQAMQELGFTPMADVETRQAEYLIEPYLPLDAITILAGVAGMGKTWLALKWAADISTGRATKDGTPGLVYYFTQENDPHIVLSPRLESLGADPENIVIMQQMADTPALTMCDARLDALASRPGCRPSLVVFDPIQSYLEKHANMNQAADVRPMMDHLANFAARYHCAVMLVSHISKPNLSGGSASDRILGSSDFRNAARSIIFVGCDPDDRSLQMDEVRPRKRGGRVDHAPGMYQLAVKKWCFHDALLPKFLAGIIPQQHTKSQYNATALQDYPYSNRKKSATITNKAQSKAFICRIKSAVERIYSYEKSTHHRYHRPGRQLSGGVPAGKRLRCPRHHPPFFCRLPRAHRPSGRPPQLPPALRRPQRFDEHPLGRRQGPP